MIADSARPGFAGAGSRVIRLTAPNPGIMTGAGTNTYLVGGEELAVIDVGSADPRHVEAVMIAGEGRIRWIVVTHAHSDHAPGAFELGELTGAPVLGYGSRGIFPGVPFQPLQCLRDGDRLDGGGWSLCVLHTPGHAHDHLCFLLEPDGVLFSGDHIMEGSTVVIAPPDGDMAEYMASLERLDQLHLRSIAPGHGDVISDPHAEIQRILAHRRQREAAIVRALAEDGPLHIRELVARLYSTTPPALHRWAALSVYAHLLKLKREGVVRGHDRRSRWSRA